MEQGEVKLLLEQIQDLSHDVLNKLEEIDAQLGDLQKSIKFGEPVDRKFIIDGINEVRYNIGAMEKEDTHEIEDTDLLMDLMKKLDELIENVLK